MPTYQLTLEYDGTDFHGWQVQPARRTVAGVLRDALHTATGEVAAMTAAGRTDSGAHAHGQVVGVTLTKWWQAQSLRHALNAALPADVVVRAATMCDAAFHARRDALDRTYRYVLAVRPERAAILRRHSWTVRGPLGLDAMRDAAASLVGRHDFAAFGGPTHPLGHTVRTVHDVSVGAAGGVGASGLDLVIVSVRADAFLRGMMRAITGALVRVGQGREDVSWVATLLDGPAARIAGIPVAPARGLHQWAVRYREPAMQEAAA